VRTQTKGEETQDVINFFKILERLIFFTGANISQKRKQPFA
jgi:hypothetical protein